MIKRRTIIVGGAAAATAFSLFPARSQVVTGRSFDWNGADFLSGGTSNVPDALPEPVFRSAPNCVTTGCKTLGPCYMQDPQERYDISEGFPGLPVRIALRVVDAETTRADVYVQDDIGLFNRRLELLPGVRFSYYAIDPNPDADYKIVPGKEPEKVTSKEFTFKLGARR